MNENSIEHSPMMTASVIREDLPTYACPLLVLALLQSSAKVPFLCKSAMMQT
jgi:hypothetical protein